MRVDLGITGPCAMAQPPPVILWLFICNVEDLPIRTAGGSPGLAPPGQLRSFCRMPIALSGTAWPHPVMLTVVTVAIAGVAQSTAARNGRRNLRIESSSRVLGRKLSHARKGHHKVENWRDAASPRERERERETAPPSSACALPAREVRLVRSANASAAAHVGERGRAACSVVLAASERLEPRRELVAEVGEALELRRAQVGPHRID